jgi:hypothetical protein
MQVTTTHTIEGTQISQYHGVVTGEAILGANIFRDLFAGIRDIVGGRSNAYESAAAPTPMKKCCARRATPPCAKWRPKPPNAAPTPLSGSISTIPPSARAVC